ncbi:MAG: ABC transporter permease [Sphingopyxis terrae]|nr:MAG: ABC transporter permease [Sphingopyxis terrae]
MNGAGVSKFARSATLAAGFVFLYGPIAILATMSFNASRLVTIWGGFSTKWYAALLADEQMLRAAQTSLSAAALSALIATVNGLLAALALARFGDFRSRTLFAGAIYAPLVLPEVVFGLGLLLFFVALDIDRGFVTLVLAHAAFTMCFATVTIHASLKDSDRSLEEAAMDLGATPFRAFTQVTLPLIAPGVVSAYLLAFTLSLDDFVIASFTTGPGATTLPMRIYSQVRLGVTPEVNAISTLLLGFVAVVLTVSAVVTRGRAKNSGMA